MYELLYGYVEQKYGEKAKLSYRDTESFIVDAKGMIFVKTLQKMLKKGFDTSNYQLKRLFLKKKILKSNWINGR